MAKITGIGGIFLNYGEDYKRLMKWYRDVLEVEVSDYGVNFYNQNQFTLLTFNNSSETSPKINFTVDNLEEMVILLKNRNVKVIKEIEKYDYGKFAQIEDILGNAIELWEPISSEYRATVEKEVKEYNSQFKDE